MSRLKVVLRRVFVCLAVAVLGFVSLADGQPVHPSDDPLFLGVPITLSPQCGFLVNCARFDDIALKVGTVGLVRGNQEPGFAALSGWVHASISFLDVVDLGAAFGGHLTRDEHGDFYGATAPGLLAAKLRVFPGPWHRRSSPGDLQLAVAYQRSIVSALLGAAEPPGFDLNTVSLLASRSFGPVDIDVGAAALFGSGPSEPRRAVQLQASAGLRLFGLARPLSPDEQLRIVAQILYRFALPGDASPSDGYVLLGVEEQTHSGYRIGVAAGPYVVGSRAGGLGMLSFSVAWGKRYRNPLGEYLASKPPWIPRFWMDLWHIDPVLGSDGCIRTDPSPQGQKIIKCVGRPDPKDAKTIVLDDGRRLAVGTRTWIRDDGVLITQRQEEIAQLDGQKTKEALLLQRLAYEAAKQGPCNVSESILDQANRAGLLPLAVVMESAPGLAIGEWMKRLDKCGLAAASSGGILPPLGRGAALRSVMRQGPGNEEVAEHSTPIKQISTPLDDRSRAHIYYGDVHKGKSSGWHHEATADPQKGTHVIEGTRSTPDKHGVYEANVMIEGVKKNARSTFFPKDWSEKEVERAILEAYQNRQPVNGRPPGWFRGKSSEGIEIEMQMRANGSIHTVYPIREEGLNR